MKLKLYQIDVFTDRVFSGNPAAVCPLKEWLDDAVLQAIAAENNLSETAYFVQSNERYQLRWFTPTVEVDLCGHATLATAHVLYNLLGYSRPSVTFETRGGDLAVSRKDELLELDFPTQDPKPCAAPRCLAAALGKAPAEVLSHSDYIAVFAREADVRAVSPDPAMLKQLDLRSVVVTAAGDEVDFVSRFFAPKQGIDEDPVTGSSHCELIPYWSGKLGKKKLVARQLSKRGGELFCQLKGDRVLIAGKAVKYMEAEIEI